MQDGSDRKHEPEAHVRSWHSTAWARLLPDPQASLLTLGMYRACQGEYLT
jgi:hypothetical protein